MNMRAKFLFSIGLLGLLCLTLPGSLRADTVYTYTGNAYTTCYGSYASSGSTCAGPYALSITFDVTAGTPVDGWTRGGAGSDITADVSTFSFTDGTGLSITPTNATADEFEIGTGSTGNTTGWYITASGVTGGIDYTALTCDTGGVSLPACTAPSGYALIESSLVIEDTGAPVGGGSTDTIVQRPPKVTPDPGTIGLTLMGIGLVMVMRKHLANGLHQATGTHCSLSHPAQH